MANADRKSDRRDEVHSAWVHTETAEHLALLELNRQLAGCGLAGFQARGSRSNPKPMAPTPRASLVDGLSSPAWVPSQGRKAPPSRLAPGAAHPIVSFSSPVHRIFHMPSDREPSDPALWAPRCGLIGPFLANQSQRAPECGRPLHLGCPAGLLGGLGCPAGLPLREPGGLPWPCSPRSFEDAKKPPRLLRSSVPLARREAGVTTVEVS